jgi:hypothetical protein
MFWHGTSIHIATCFSIVHSVLPQTVLPLCSDGSIGQCCPELAVVALLLDLIRDTHACLFFFEQYGETWVVLATIQSHRTGTGGLTRRPVSQHIDRSPSPELGALPHLALAHPRLVDVYLRGVLYHFLAAVLQFDGGGWDSPRPSPWLQRPRCGIAACQHVGRPLPSLFLPPLQCVPAVPETHSSS